MKTADGSAAGLRGRLSKPVLRTQPDDRLVELVREGSDLSFEVIVERYHDALLRYCRRFLDPARCEDVVQQAFTNALIFMRESDRELALRAWLYRVVHNSALKVIAGKSNREAELSTEIAGVATTGAIVESRDEFRRVINEIGSLSDSERQALLMRTFEGDSYETIALALESTPNGARQLIHRVRTKLRAAAAMLLPLPLLRWFAQAGNAQAATVAGGAGTAGIAVKLAAAVTVGVIATGAGVVATQSGKSKHDGNGATVASADRAASTSSRADAVASGGRTPAVKHDTQVSQGGSTPGQPGGGHGDAGNSGGPLDGLTPHGDTPSSGADAGGSSGSSAAGGADSQTKSTGSGSGGSGSKGSGSKPPSGTTGGTTGGGSTGTQTNGTTGTSSTASASSGTLIVNSSEDSNRLRIARSGQRILVTDTGGPAVRPTGGGCATVSATQVGCPVGAVGAVQVKAGRGDDTITVDGSIDRQVIVDGSYGSDTLIAEGGPNNNFNGGQDADVLRGGPGADTLDGSTGDDTIDGRSGGDNLLGSAGNDRICGSDGNDSISAGAGDDQVYGGPGTDIMGGDAGTDTIFSPPSGNTISSFERTMPGATLSC